MFKVLKEVFSILTYKQRKRLYVLQCLVIIMAFTELVGIASITPFMALVGDIGLLDGHGFLARVYLFSGIKEPMDFLFYSGLAVLVVLTISTFFSMFTMWKLSVYATKVGVEIADRLYSYYMQKDWPYHVNNSSSYLTKQVSVEAMRVSNGIIQPIMQMNSKMVLVFFISVSLFTYNPFVATSGLVLFIASYFILYKIVRNRLSSNGKSISTINAKRFLLMNEGFGGIKDVLLLNRHSDFVSRLKKTGEELSYSQASNKTISLLPRYFMELVAFGSMITLVLFLIKRNDGDLGSILPVLAIYALAAFKLLPALQQIYASISTVKGNLFAFDSIKNDLKDGLLKDLSCSQDKYEFKARSPSVVLDGDICLKDIKFYYPNKKSPAVNNVSMTIPINKIVGIVGASGSGKSTVVDILLGLLISQQGEIFVNGEKINSLNRRQWQDKIGFVPQSIFLSEGSVAENIAFGLPEKDIDFKKLKKAIELAHLSELLDQLPEGLDTKVGERGVQLSGGQRQRIGIARALYNQASVLVFDEATSALDSITEKIIMEAIHNFNGEKTIVMIAHRLKTVRKCDIIYFMDKGEVVDQGSYEGLIKKNPSFRLMSESS